MNVSPMPQASLLDAADSADGKKEQARFVTATCRLMTLKCVVRRLMIVCVLFAHFVGKHGVIQMHQFLIGSPPSNPEAPIVEVKSGEGDVATTLPAEAGLRWFIHYEFMNVHGVLA